MWIPNIFAIFAILQVVPVAIIVVILKSILDRNLIDLAIQQLESGRLNPQGGHNANFNLNGIKMVVITHKKISQAHRERILKAVLKNIPGGLVADFQTNKKICGGMIITVGASTVDYSLLDRLRRAV